MYTLFAAAVASVIVYAFLPRPVPVDLAQVVRGPMQVTVEDDGIGMTPEELAKLQNSLYQDAEEERSKRTGGIALKNVSDRIRLYHSDKYGMSIQSKKHKGTKVTLVLPARLYVQAESEESR